MVTIKVSGRHSDTADSKIGQVIEEFLDIAEVFGNIQAILGPAVRGHKKYGGVSGVRVIKYSQTGVEVKVQVEDDKSSRRIFILNPPPGLSAERFFAMLKKAEAKLSVGRPPAASEEDEDDTLPVSAGDDVLVEDDDCTAVVAPPSPIAFQAEAERLLEAFLSTDDAAHRKAEEVVVIKRKLGQVQLEIRDVERQRQAADSDRADVEATIVDLIGRIERLNAELLAARENSVEAGVRAEKATVAVERLRHDAELIRAALAEAEAEAARLALEAENLQQQHTEAEARLRMASVAEKIKGLSAEDLLVAAKLAGIDLAGALKTTP